MKYLRPFPWHLSGGGGVFFGGGGGEGGRHGECFDEKLKLVDHLGP